MNPGALHNLLRCTLLCIVWCMLPHCGKAQQYVYVNTDNLIMRSLPLDRYEVFMVLHAPTRLLVTEPHDDVVNQKGVKERFYCVSVVFRNRIGIRTVIGWVERKYVVASPDKVTWPVENRHLLTDLLSVHSYNDRVLYNNELFPPPVYKGGTTVTGPEATAHSYHTGKRGGCYYLNGKGNKVYVDKSLCNCH